MMSIKKLALVTCVALSALSPASARAAEGGALPHLSWSFEGVNGTYDRASLQRGFKVYREVCGACHSMDKVYYRDLEALGYDEDQIKAVAAEYTFIDGPNDEGEMYERPGRPSDPFKAPYASREQSMYANNGAYPPDMSLLAKARHGGANYIYGILTGYGHAPEGHEVPEGKYWNTMMPGHIIAMAPPLQDGQVSYDDNASQTVDQYAKDVATFLTWASEPHMEDRKRVGITAFLFLLVFTGVMYTVKKKLWAKIH
ncbi:MAG: cytochrome c1 [Micavibrio aeruginosavorus]|uniref:Cytochrome c1 n=1 Tax=Micavibrio aeruginosavorus TaxID=349221 RepID=A0A7T5R1J4_9BACT|nr:MAG: cytochrome c1 [Micavibrio aeruginosavorus]